MLVMSERKQTGLTPEATGLRQRAEALLKKKGSKTVAELSEADYLTRIHELELHQIELEMQAAELLAANMKASAVAAKYAQLYEVAPSGYFSLSHMGDIIELNLTGANMLGKERRRLINNHFALFISDDTRPIFHHFFENIVNLKVEQTCQVSLLRKGKLQMHVQLTGIVSENEEGCLLTAVDITERFLTNIELAFQSKEKGKRADEKRRLALILTGANAGTWEWNIQTGGTIFNERWANMIGYTLEELSPVSIETWKKYTHPDDLKRSDELLEKHSKEDLEYYECEVRMKHKNGDWVWVIDRGRINKWDADQKPLLMSGTHQDITERKAAEDTIKKYSEALENSNTELENFAHVASHDLQEPLRMVISFLNMLEKKLEGKLDESEKQYFHFATDGAARMKILISDLLKYASFGNTKEGFVSIDLNESMKYIDLILREKIYESRAVVNIQRLPKIVAHKTFINELFVNLISNALKYHGEKDPVIDIGYHEEKDAYRFYVKDNGIGISAEHFEKIFGLYQRLHERSAYSGTGIGLALCKKVVDIHHGKIWVESEPGKGSCFYFTIPK